MEAILKISKKLLKQLLILEQLSHTEGKYLLYPLNKDEMIDGNQTFVMDTEREQKELDNNINYVIKEGKTTERKKIVLEDS